MKSYYPFTLTCTVLLTNLVSLFAGESDMPSQPAKGTPAQSVQERKERELANSRMQGACEASASLSARLSPHDYSSETLQSFTQRIQPLVLNSCGRGACHSSSAKGGYQLLRPASPSQVTPTLTRHNLLQTLALIDREAPQASSLLRKALEVHGGATSPPLASRDAPAYQTLEAWVLKVASPVSAKSEPEPMPQSRPGSASVLPGQIVGTGGILRTAFQPPTPTNEPILPANQSPSLMLSTIPGVNYQNGSVIPSMPPGQTVLTKGQPKADRGAFWSRKPFNFSFIDNFWNRGNSTPLPDLQSVPTFSDPALGGQGNGVPLMPSPPAPPMGTGTGSDPGSLPQQPPP